MRVTKEQILSIANDVITMQRYEGQLITPQLVYAIAKVESDLESEAVRYEPHYKWLYKPDEVRPAGCTVETEIVLQKMSWGLMQVMGAVFREYGFYGWLTEATNIVRNITFGVKHLIVLEKRGRLHKGSMYKLEDLISDYNDGDWRVLNNKVYVNKVKKELANV